MTQMVEKVILIAHKLFAPPVLYGIKGSSATVSQHTKKGNEQILPKIALNRASEHSFHQLCYHF